MKGAPFEVGDKVYYVSGQHGARSNNPLYGTSYQCQGTVIKCGEGDYCSIEVKWNNGTTNSYYRADLAGIDKRGLPYFKSDPNKAFLHRKGAKKTKECKHCGFANSIVNYHCDNCGSANKWGKIQ